MAETDEAVDVALNVFGPVNDGSQSGEAREAEARAQLVAHLRGQLGDAAPSLSFAELARRWYAALELPAADTSALTDEAPSLTSDGVLVDVTDDEDTGAPHAVREGHQCLHSDQLPAHRVHDLLEALARAGRPPSPRPMVRTAGAHAETHWRRTAAAGYMYRRTGDAYIVARLRDWHTHRHAPPPRDVHEE